MKTFSTMRGCSSAAISIASSASRSWWKSRCNPVATERFVDQPLQYTAATAARRIFRRTYRPYYRPCFNTLKCLTRDSESVCVARYSSTSDKKVILFNNGSFGFRMKNLADLFHSPLPRCLRLIIHCFDPRSQSIDNRFQLRSFCHQHFAPGAGRIRDGNLTLPGDFSCNFRVAIADTLSRLALVG